MTEYPTPSASDWCLVEDGFRPDLLPHSESVFALANGCMAVRVPLETNPLLGDAGFYVAARLGLTDTDLATWRDIAEKLHFPFDTERSIHEQFEVYFRLPEKAIDRSLSRMQCTGPVQHSFKPTKVAQQVDTTLMYWMFADAFPTAVRRAAYRYYESRCSHISSLSRCIFAAVAAQTGLLQEACRQFLLSAEEDVARDTRTFTAAMDPGKVKSRK